MGAYAQQAAHDIREVSRPGREAAYKRYLDEVDPDQVLPEAERRRRADALQKLHMTRLAFLSSRARRKSTS